jgi:tryptophan-rich hypothetical protein
MNKINPQKLLSSKWTAVEPTKKEKHFMVTEIEFDEEGVVLLCSLQAVFSKRTTPINWQDLADDSNWIHGWK